MTTQTIFRRAHASNYVAISNELAREVTLSHRERGLLVWLLSYPTDWTVSLQTLVTAEDSLRSLRRVVQRLEDAGYIKRERERDPATGRLGRAVLFVYDEPLPPEERTRDTRRKASPKTENATVEPKTKKRTQAATGSATGKTPMTKNPTVGNWPTTKTEEDTKTETTTKTAVVVSPLPEKPVVVEPERPTVFAEYERQFGLMLTAGIADTLKDMAAEYGEDWTRDALGITATSGKRGNLRYVEGILRRWKTEGREPERTATTVVVDEKTAWRAAQKGRPNVRYDAAIDMLLPAFKDEDDRRRYITEYLNMPYVPFAEEVAS